MGVGITALKQAGVNAAQGAVASGIQSLFNLGLMRREHKYEKENLRLQDQYQRRLMADTPSINKSALINAGYSSADPEGVGTSTPTLSGPSSSASGSVGMSSIPGVDLSAMRSQESQAKLLDSQRKLNEIEARWKEKGLKADIDLANAKTKEILDTLPQRVTNLAQEYDNMVAQKQLTVEQKNKIVQDTQYVIEQIASIQYENKYKDKLEYYKAEQAAEQFRKLSYEADIEGMKAYLADFGIIAGYNLIQSIAAVALSGNDDILSTAFGTIKSAAGELPDVAASAVEALFDAIVDLPKSVVSKIIEKAKALPGKVKDAFEGK